MPIRTSRKIYIKKLKVKRDKILCIVLAEGKGSTWLFIDDKSERFSVKDNTYFTLSEGTHICGSGRFMIFVEGVSTPLHHGYIEKELFTKEVIDKETGEKKVLKLNRIKGLKYDSKIIDILLNRHLADEFTRQHIDLPNLVIIILMIVVVILGVINIVLTWFH